MEWLVGACAVILWCIYGAIKDCLIELRRLTSAVQDHQALFVDKVDRISSDLFDLNEKSTNLNTVADAFYDEHIKARRGY